MHPSCFRRTIIQPRLFQQACRLASTRQSPVKRGLTSSQRSRAVPSTHPDKEIENDDDDDIRWFEKDVETGAIRRVAGDPNEMERKELRDKILALEAELKEYESEDSIKDMMGVLEPQERAKVEAALQGRKSKEQALTTGLEIRHELPPLTGPVLKRLNASLHDAALHPTSTKRRKDLWRWYIRGKTNIPALPSMIPARAWEVLWKTQSVESPTNPQRLRHMTFLLDDMVSVGHRLTKEQRYIYVDALLEMGETEKALQRWEAEYASDIGSRHVTLELGISIFTKLGHLDRAHHLLQEYLEQHRNRNPRVILPLIKANVQIGNDHMAFSLYLFMRARLGGAMTVDDYDTVYLYFLNKDKKDLALAVFRDMMLQGSWQLRDPFVTQKKQDDLYEVMTNRMDMLHSSAVTSSEVNNVSLAALTALPHEWQNKYFYAAWLKRLLGLNRVEAAAKVIELMYERGLEPDANHMSGLIAAYLRLEDPASREQGLALGWSMIQQRLDFAFQRRELKRQGRNLPIASVHYSQEGPGPISVYKPSEEAKQPLELPVRIARPLPRATIETFNVLILHYVLHEQWEHVYHLERMLRPAEIKPDTYFRNHILQTELYDKNAQLVWRHFVSSARAIAPDMLTYQCLWTAELNFLNGDDRTGFPLPRRLFSVMTTWLSSLDESDSAAAKEAFDLDIYGRIIQSFCLEKDLAGGLVAVHALAQHFGQYPDHDIAEVIATAVSNISEVRPPTTRSRRSRVQLPASQARYKNTTKVLEAVASRREKAALELGVDPKKLEGQERAEENLNSLSEFLRTVLVRVLGDAATVESAIAQAAEEMGVPGIRTGDIDAYNVM